MAVYFSSTNASVYILPAGGILVIELRGFIEEKEYQEAFKKLFEAAKEKRASNFVLDFSGLESSSARSRNWLKTDFLEIVSKEFSTIAVAVVKSQTPFQASAGHKIQELVEMHHKHLEISSFNTFVEATSWLIEQ